MKRLVFIIAIIAMVGIVASCGEGKYIHMLYGPDMSPEQIKEQAYFDGYSFGKMRALSAKDDIENILLRCYTIQRAPSPISAASQAFFQYLAKDTFKDELGNDTATGQGFTWALERFGRRVGVTIDSKTKQLIPDLKKFDRELFLHFVQAYTDGVTDVKNSIK